jgi:hypothetical protein
MSDLRARFVAHFGPDLAETIEHVTEHHAKVLPAPLDHGSNSFRFALVWTIGFECLTRPAFRQEHGITAAWAELSAWIRDEADLTSFDGTMDLAGRGRGLFDAILGPRSEDDVKAGLDAAYDWLASAAVAGTA